MSRIYEGPGSANISCFCQITIKLLFIDIYIVVLYKCTYYVMVHKSNDNASDIIYGYKKQFLQNKIL